MTVSVTAARPLQTIVTDYAMFDKARRIREWLWEISGLIRRLNEGPNPYYGASEDGLVLIEYYGGPSCVGTPLGQWSCTGGGCHEQDWLEQAKERLGLVMLQEEIQNDQGCYGPVWGITIDLDGEPLPEPKWDCRSIGVGMNTRGAVVNNTALSKEELLETLRRENVPCPEYAPEWVYPVDWIQYAVHNDMQYQYSKLLWSRVKEQIKFVEWDDKVDPHWELVPLYTSEDRLEEGRALGHALGHLSEKAVRDGRFYSVRSAEGERLLSLSTYYERNIENTDWHWVCKHIVGKNNRPPTPDEISLVERLLAPRECVVQYDPNTIC